MMFIVDENHPVKLGGCVQLEHGLQAYAKTDAKYNDSPVLYPKGTILEL